MKSKNSKIVKTKNEKIMIFSDCAMCNHEKDRFTKEQEASGLLSLFLLGFSWAL